MRRKDQQITDPAAVEEVLRRARFLRLAMCDADGPYIVTVCFGCEPGRLYFHSAAEGRKLDTIRSDPRVAFMVDVDAEVVVGGPGCSSTVNYSSLIGFGAASIVDDPDEKLHGLDLLMSHYASDGARPGGYGPGSLGRTAVVRIDIHEMTGKRSGSD